VGVCLGVFDTLFESGDARICGWVFSFVVVGSRHSGCTIFTRVLTVAREKTTIDAKLGIYMRESRIEPIRRMKG